MTGGTGPRRPLVSFAADSSATLIPGIGMDREAR
jgi:hypothetical protein